MAATGGTEKSLTDGVVPRKGPVIFDRKSTSEGIFEARRLLNPIPTSRTEPRIRIPLRQPEFLTRADFFRTSWWARLGTILSRYPAHLTLISNRYFRDVPVRPRRFGVKQLAISLVVHAGWLILLPLMLRYLPFRAAQASMVLGKDQQVLYYHLANPEHRVKAP